MRVCASRSQGVKFQMGLVQFLLQAQEGFQGILGFAPLILGWLLYILKEGVTSVLILHLQEKLFLRQLTHCLQSHTVAERYV